MIFRRKPAPTTVVRYSTAKETGEHTELQQLHVALRAQRRARDLALAAERLETDANAALDEARKGVRRIAEQGR